MSAPSLFSLAQEKKQVPRKEHLPNQVTEVARLEASLNAHSSCGDVAADGSFASAATQ